MKNNEVHQYWESQAKKHKTSHLATMPDFYSHRKELEVLKKYLKDGVDVLEFGCGNGIISRGLLEAYNFKSYRGADYSKAMISECQTFSFDKKSEVTYVEGNVLDYQPPNPVDYIFTDRCLINLASHAEHVGAIINIHSCLKDKGIFLMTECSKTGLDNINKARKTFDLPAITERWHNCYIEENRLLKEINSYFNVEAIDSFNSTYFLLSRVVNALLSSPNDGPDYLSEINRIASQLPPEGDYAPLKLFILKKK